MKRLNVWLLGLSIVVPAMLAFSAPGDRGVRAETSFTNAQILAFVQWTADQHQKLVDLRRARAAQVKPLHDQIRQLELQIRAIDVQFDQNEAALLTPAQLAAAQGLLRDLEIRRAEERRIAEERRHLAEAEFHADERIHHGFATTPSQTVNAVHHTEVDRHLANEERHIDAERRAEERRHEEHVAGKTDHPIVSREERQKEREHLHQEIERMNHRLNELREEKEVKEAGKTTVSVPTK